MGTSLNMLGEKSLRKNVGELQSYMEVCTAIRLQNIAWHKDNV